MHGPDIVARTISKPTFRGKKATGKAWQYHGRSDGHSKLACWALLFDFLAECDVFQKHVAAGRVSFAVNFLLVGPINKTLDLVLCVVPKSRMAAKRRTFVDYATKYGVQLDAAEASLLASLPVMEEELSSDISEVLVAVEAKACMTDLVGAIPRLFAEILATGYLAKQAATSCITASYTVVNSASTFVSPGSAELKKHRQPEDTDAVLRMISKAIPTARKEPSLGYDVLGVSVIECRNDGSQVTVVNSPPAPSSTDFYHYERMIRALCGAYRQRFGDL